MTRCGGFYRTLTACPFASAEPPRGVATWFEGHNRLDAKLNYSP
jgi:hypothetical protein